MYPDLLNLYGDAGNIASLKQRLVWRGIDAEVVSHTMADGEPDFSDVDIIVLGGASSREERTVTEKLLPLKDKLAEYINADGTLFATCGGMDILGKSYESNGETITGLGVLDIYTKESKNRMTGDVILASSIFDGEIVGFENRAGKTYIGELSPLGRVTEGGGNNGEDMTEGVVYKNVTASHLHGPLLPKNPKLCDYILECALRKKYTVFSKLTPLSDELETQANEFIVNRYKK